MFSFLFFLFNFLGLSSQPVGVQFPHKGSNLHPLHWKFKVLTTGQPREVSFVFLLFFFDCFLIPNPNGDSPVWSLHHLPVVDSLQCSPRTLLHLNSCQDNSKSSWFQAYLSCFIYYLLNLVILLSSSFPLNHYFLRTFQMFLNPTI